MVLFIFIMSILAIAMLVVLLIEWISMKGYPIDYSYAWFIMEQNKKEQKRFEAEYEAERGWREAVIEWAQKEHKWMPSESK